MKSDILLEAGTNELEIMVINIDGQLHGVNVAKVREVILPQVVRRVVNAPECVEGVFQLRDRVVELVDLKQFLGFGAFTGDEKQDQTRSQIMVTEFNNLVIGFRVNAVERIQRMSWEQILPVPYGCAADGVPLVGFVNLDGNIVQMLDLESIVCEIKPNMRMNTDGVEANDARRSKQILIAEDSETIRAMMLNQLAIAGYTEVHAFGDGLGAWQYLERTLRGEVRPVELVVSDIEMPRLDGLHLCRRIRETEGLRQLPVILFSSLVSEGNLNKGKQVGASMQITKPQLGKLVNIADGFLGISTSEPAAKE